MLVKQVVEFGNIPERRRIQLANFPHARDTLVSLSPSHLLGRHCAILGATGGGKSWTLSLLVEEIVRLNGKAILFDATGEFQTQDAPGVVHVHLGGTSAGPNDTRRFVSFPYWQLTESDLFVLLRPSPGVQAPKLKEALKSLKVAHLAPALANNGVVRKAGQLKQPFEQACIQHAIALNRPGAHFDIMRLSNQVWEECIYPNGLGNQALTHWGGPTPNEQSACVTLLSRIESEVNSPSLACLFSPGGLDQLPNVIQAFLTNPAQRVLRVSLEYRNVVEKACGDLDSSAAKFLPTLGQGEALIVGVSSSLREGLLTGVPLPVD
ncbi:helicase HerA domain-containing protein [Cupriavidus gilardii]|uniref:helicase HerA domain-containing protein n=1 Tax=Cupriavidus gilardii TaxID=82541 RepID=UPI001FD3F32D|nr:DUF87 domain-containing protein [Cupriavidus gilardii]MCT9073499.1 ATP-binding protein [Cupriavidus gilardii]